MAVTKLAIDLHRRREARADDERIRCASTLRKFLGEFLVERPQPGSERHSGRSIKPLSADQAAPLWQVVHDRVSQFVNLQPHGRLQPHGAGHAASFFSQV
jgi:hypothetical protein